VKLLLKDFQSEKVTELVGRLRQASQSVRSGDLEAVSLSSPTGSGKTVMATAAIELILEGDDRGAPQADATFLWITDQPELNGQTRRKMLDASSVLGPSKLVVVETSFDHETFPVGAVYFLNTQKLARNALLVSTTGDRRNYTIWETISNTVSQRPTRFYVFIDEAHRGMTENAQARNEANSIIQKFIKGSDAIPPIPIIVGISATLDRFNQLLAGQARPRITRPVVVDPAEVRASGLLKDKIRLHHLEDAQPSDMTLLAAAARSWQDFVQRWDTYCEAQQELPIRPLLVVQVQDGTARQLSQTDIGAAMRIIDDAVGPLPNEAFAHAFDEKTTLSIAGRDLRYLAPSEIDADPSVKVVFFKTSLNTGWDCPRAEVMMSFRTAEDATFIAQLVGRMVRTPLARRIDSDESLNRVSLYLPHYSAAGLKRVVDYLSASNPDILPPVEIEMGEDVVTLRRADFMDDAFAALHRLPSYVIPQGRKTSQVRRLMKLGRLLANDGIVPDGPELATTTMLGIIHSEYERLKDTPKFQKVVEQKGKVPVREVDWPVHGDLELDQAETRLLDIAAEDLDDLFGTAGRKLGDGLHKAWWKARVDEDSGAKDRAKLEMVALCLDGNVFAKLEHVAQDTVQTWLTLHRPAIEALNEGGRQAYTEIYQLAADPEQVPFHCPASIDVSKAEQTWINHLHVDERGLFPAKLNRWETMVIEEELNREGLVAWLRNPDRKLWSLRIPYKLGGEVKPFYPDFLIVRQEGQRLVVDLLDPHMINLADAPAKAAGLADYAAKHAMEFGRIELIIVDGDDILRLDLKDERWRNRVRGVSTVGHLRDLFDLAS